MTFYLTSYFGIEQLDLTAETHQIHIKQLVTAQAALVAPACKSVVDESALATHYSRLLETTVEADYDAWSNLQLETHDVALVGQAGWWLVTLSPYGRLLSLAALLPTGLNDPQALTKYGQEWRELKAMLAARDQVGALLEAGDCATYLTKAWHNELLTEREREIRLRDVADLIHHHNLNFSVADILRAAIVKYDLRAAPGNLKNDRVERWEIARAFFSISFR